MTEATTTPEALEPDQVRLESERLHGGAAVLTVAGEIDLHAAEKLRHGLKALIDDACDLVIVDLSAVTFIDSMTLGVLVGAARTIRERGRDLRIVCTNRNITRILEMTRLDRLLDVYASRSAALEASSRAP